MNIIQKINEFRKEAMHANRCFDNYLLAKDDMLPLLEAVFKSGSDIIELHKIDLAVDMFKETGDFEFLAKPLRGCRIFGMDIKLEMDKLHPVYGNPFDMC